MQGLPSSQGQVSPLNGSGPAWAQMPASWTQKSRVHTWPSSQLRGVPGVQVPALQRSFTVQPSPSSQLAVLKTKPQPASGAQKGEVHGFESSGQVTVPPPRQLPLEQ